MISRSDCVYLLGELKDDGIDTDEQINKLYASDGLPFDVLKFINDHRQIDLSAFYTQIRRSGNNKHSNLYKNIVDEEADIQEAPITLSALLTQVLRYAKKANNRQMFLRHARADEITEALSEYLDGNGLTKCIKVLGIIKTDLKVFESFDHN